MRHHGRFAESGLIDYSDAGDPRSGELRAQLLASDTTRRPPGARSAPTWPGRAPGVPRRLGEPSEWGGDLAVVQAAGGVVACRVRVDRLSLTVVAGQPQHVDVVPVERPAP